VPQRRAASPGRSYLESSFFGSGTMRTFLRLLIIPPRMPASFLECKSVHTGMSIDVNNFLKTGRPSTSHWSRTLAAQVVDAAGATLGIFRPG
jgi:hypothetical protein